MRCTWQLIFLLGLTSTLGRKDPYAEDDELEEEKPTPSLHGDIINWADMIKNYIQQLANEAINRDYTQGLFDNATYAKEVKNGTKIVEDLQRELSNYFAQRKEAAKRIADAAVAAYDSETSSSKFTPRHLKELRGKKPAIYLDSDDPKPLPKRVSQGFFKQPVISNKSTVKIADEVPRDLNHTISSVKWTFELERVMTENTNKTKDLRWQYFGTKTGVLRLFPGREWSSNFLGFYEDYDPRTRPWYISSTSGPKDVVVVLDCSMSMAGVKFGVARHLISAIITSLTKKDYMNVVCARESSWDDLGKWHPQNSQVLSCQENHLVPATSAFRKDLINKINELRPGGTTEVLDGFEKAFRLLESKPRAGCHSILIFVTDGKDTDTDSVRCGPGYYTRSGYVPGPLCKYAWNKTLERVGELYKSMKRTKIFSFLIQDDGEVFPGKLACDNQGGFFKLMSSQNLISNLESYFTYLAKSTPELEKGIWTEPYLDNFGLGVMITYAIPAISKRDQSLIGVAGVDVTVEEIEMIFTRYQWGSVSSFLIDKEGQTIFHPLLLPNSNLRDDPVFIPINQLEQDRDGSPKEFNEVLEKMTRGITGDLHIEKARRGMPKGDFRAGVRYDIMPLTYYFASVNNSDYSFAIVLSETDKIFRSLQEPKNPERYGPSYFNLLIEYNSSLVRTYYPDAFEKLNTVYNDSKYQLLRVTYNHSSIMLSPQCHCDPSAYSIQDDYALKTLRAHRYMNEHTAHADCEHNGDYEKGTKAYILLSKPIEEKWKERDPDIVKHVMWTYVGMRSGVFRTFPGHRSVKMYDPTSRSWYRRTMANPSKISISTPYFDLAGSGKVVTISQAVFEGKEELGDTHKEICRNPMNKPGGCPCRDDEQCKSGRCYLSINDNKYTCATERIEAITSLDIKYDSFHDRIFNITKVLKSNGVQFNCAAVYPCTNLPNANCTTNCYLFDNRANVIIARKFRDATALDENKYKGVTLGNIEGDIMKELIYKHALFIREDSIDFQGVCSFSASSVRVTMDGIPRTPQEEDDYSRKRIPIPKFQNSYGCIQDVVSFALNTTRLNRTQMIVGNVSGPCSTGYYYVTSVRDTNLFLLVIQDSVIEQEDAGINFNCIITKGVSSSGAYRILNGTCAHNDSSSKTLDENKKCPKHVQVNLTCTYSGSERQGVNIFNVLITAWSFALSIFI